MDQRLQMAMQKLAQFPPEIQQQILAEVKGAGGGMPQQQVPPNRYDEQTPQGGMARMQQRPQMPPPQQRPQMPQAPPPRPQQASLPQAPPKKPQPQQLPQYGQGRAKGKMSGQSLSKIVELLKAQQAPSGYPNGLKPGGVNLL